jgi:hypothetical protein
MLSSWTTREASAFRVHRPRSGLTPAVLVDDLADRTAPYWTV